MPHRFASFCNMRGWNGLRCGVARMMLMFVNARCPIDPCLAPCNRLEPATEADLLCFPTDQVTVHGQHFLRSQPDVVKLADMFRRNLLILLTTVWVILPPLAQACATHCAMHQAASTSGLMHDAQSMPGCPAASTPAGG